MRKPEDDISLINGEGYMVNAKEYGKHIEDSIDDTEVHPTLYIHLIEFTITVS